MNILSRQSPRALSRPPPDGRKVIIADHKSSAPTPHSGWPLPNRESRIPSPVHQAERTNRPAQAGRFVPNHRGQRRLGRSKLVAEHHLPDAP